VISIIVEEPGCLVNEFDQSRDIARLERDRQSREGGYSMCLARGGLALSDPHVLTTRYAFVSPVEVLEVD
jgi:hypothetical protein